MGTLRMQTNSGTVAMDDGYPIVFTGSAGTITVYTTAGGSYRVNLPVGAYSVTDGYAEWGCALPAVITPGSVQVVPFATVTKNLTTTGCIFF